MNRIGIDFGGTKIEAAAIDEAGAFRSRIRIPNPGSYDAALVALRQLLAAVEGEAGPTHSIGIGMPGSISPRTGLIRNANTAWLNGRHFVADAEAALGRPLRAANDANCLALSEARDGAGVGAASVFAAILGTGCGGGIVVNGRIVAGAEGLAGEWGHVPLPWPTAEEWPSPPCWCGQAGCLELWISGSGIARDHASGLTALEIAAHAETGDAAARATLARFHDRLGRALAMVVNILDPEVIVLGGGLSNLPSLYTAVPPLIRARVFGDGWDGRLVPARWGDSSGVRGAAMLWDEPSR